MVPGVNVTQMSARDVNITLRAPTGSLENSTLVLLDGRSIYQDFFGFVMWDFIPVDADQMKQIEVIRGPASAVWGSNALTGVVNVITKTPREMVGNSVSIQFGQFDRTPRDDSFDGGGLFTINATHAQAPTERFAFKISGGLTAQEAFIRPTGPVPNGSGTRLPCIPEPRDQAAETRRARRLRLSRPPQKTDSRGGHCRNRRHHLHRTGPARRAGRFDVQVRPRRVPPRSVPAAGLRQLAERRRAADATGRRAGQRGQPDVRKPVLRRGALQRQRDRHTPRRSRTAATSATTGSTSRWLRMDTTAPKEARTSRTKSSSRIGSGGSSAHASTGSAC